MPERTRSSSSILATKPWSMYLRGANATCANPTGTLAPVYYTGTVTDTQTSVMQDVVTPDFKKLQAKGHIFNNPMDKLVVTTTQSVTEINFNLFYYYTSCNPPKQLWRGFEEVGGLYADNLMYGATNHGWASTPTIDINYHVNLAVTKMWAKADQSKAAALASLGEARETISSICQILTRVWKIGRAAKKLDLRYLANQLSPKELSDRYMELRYAIRPLYYDAKQIIDALSHEKPEYDRFTFRGRSKESKTSEQTYTYDIGLSDPAGTKAHILIKGTTLRDVDVRAGLLTHVDPPSQLNVWGFDSIIETAWELTPFSFIIDWFFNIGDTIASWTPEAGLKPLASWVVVTDTILQTAEIIHCSGIYNPGVTYVDPKVMLTAPAVKSILTYHKYRVPDPQRSILPTFNLKLDVLKLIDLLIIGKKMCR